MMKKTLLVRNELEILHDLAHLFARFKEANMKKDTLKCQKVADKILKEIECLET